VGVKVYDAHKKEHFTLRAKLERAKVDSRALSQTIGVSEAGAKNGCFQCEGEGMNFMCGTPQRGGVDIHTANTTEDQENEVDSGSEASYPSSISDDDNVVDEEEELPSHPEEAALIHGKVKSRDNAPSRKMKVSKMVYVGTERWLPLHGEVATYLRTEAAKLNPRSPLGPNDPQEAAPRRREEVKMQAAAARLKVLGINPLPARRAKAVVDAAKKEAVVRYSPLLGSGMPLTRSNFDFMHALANLALLVRCALLGYGMPEAKTGLDFLKHEQETNKRFVNVAQTIDGMKGMPFILNVAEKKLVNNRNELAHAGYIHPEFTGGGLRKGFQEYATGGMHGMSCTGHIGLFSPFGRYLLDGTLDHPAVGFGDTKLNFTYHDMVMELMIAINYLRLKETTVKEGEKTFNMVATAMTKLQMALPMFYATHATHQVLHIAEELPTTFYAVFKLEMLMRTIRNKMHNMNPAQRDANIHINVNRHHGVFIGGLTGEHPVEGGIDGAHERLCSAKLQTPAATEYARSGRDVTGNKSLK
jgi:hypothetical protein